MLAENDLAMHFVCMREELQALIDNTKRFWISNCGCREGKEGGCRQSRMDVCLMFSDGIGSSGSGKREVTREDVAGIMREAELKHLVTRPYRSEDRKTVEGSCICCHDCCAYFLNTEERCDKGAFIEETDAKECVDCGACVDLCYFGARKMVGDKLVVDREKCYGCGLCRDGCAVDCIKMLARG